MDLDYGTAFVCAPSCGDVLKLSISIDEDNIIEDVMVKAFGCDLAKTIDRRLGIIIGMPVEEIIMADPMTFVDQEDENLHIGVLIINGLRAAITNYAKKKYSEENDCEQCSSVDIKT